jgi:opacity protein-like surface antigen
MSNRILLASAAALLVAGPAFAGGFAAPVVTPAPAAPVVVPVAPVATNDWSGFYAGGQLGFGRASTDITFEEGDESETFEAFDGEGALYGLHAGYMFDFGRIVAGAEVDFDGTQIALSDTVEDEEIAEIGSVLRGKVRVGFDAGRLLPYVTAGIARANVNFEDEVDEEAYEDSYDGRFVGLGASYMVSERFMVGVEALRHDFEDAPALTTEVDGGPSFDTMVNTLTLRGSIRF